MLSRSINQGEPSLGKLTIGGNVLKEEVPSFRHFKWAVTIFLTYFGLRLIYFATSISPAIPPDEATHFGICQIFSRAFFFPTNSPETYEYGLVTNIPWLYYWTMGKLLHLNFFGISDLVFLRLLNIPLAFGTVYYTWRLMRLLTEDSPSQILLVVAMTNTMMFSFISATVTYDNLTNLLAAASTFYLFAYLNEHAGNMLMASLICQMLGCLTKKAFLPLVLVLTLILIVNGIKNIRPFLLTAIKEYFQHSGKRSLALFTLLAALALNLQLYGGNYLRYHKFDPPMEEVLTVESAMQNRLAARDLIFGQYKEGRISKEQALAMASQIKHRSDRSNVVYLVENYAAMKENGQTTVGLVEYIPFWVQNMVASIFSIYGHQQLLNSAIAITAFYVLIGLSCFAFIFRLHEEESLRISVYLAVVAAFYAVFLMYAVNYAAYRYYCAPGIALQGRYIFPILGPVYVLSSMYLLRLFKRRYLQIGLCVTVSALFVAADFPVFLSRVSPQWFAWSLG